jgi:tRNA-dihydrouridine synthase
MVQKKETNIKILLAPLQGLTDYIYRKTFSKYFQGIDLSYSPFLRIERGEIRKSKIKDVLPENNKGIKLIPQILTNDTNDFLYLVNLLKDMEYDEINWNLGCPFPMLTKQGMGSGMLQYPEKIKQILDEIFPLVNCKLSIKMRNGYDNSKSILDILPILNNFPLTEIIIHPRTGKQMYKGDVNLDIFKQCLEISSHNVSYNGDINNIERYQQFHEIFPSINSIMIGRGILANPFLASEIKKLTQPDNKKEIIGKFHDSLFEQYCSVLSGDSHILNKMVPLWEYLSTSFTNNKKIFKAIKKTNKVNKYELTVRDILKNEEWDK